MNKIKIYSPSIDIDNLDFDEFIELMKGNYIIAFDVMASQFERISLQLNKIAFKNNYIYGFCMTGIAGYLYYYKHSSMLKNKVDEILKVEHEKKINKL